MEQIDAIMSAVNGALLKAGLQPLDVPASPTLTPPMDFRRSQNRPSHVMKTASIYHFQQTIELVPLFDLHIGHKGCNMQKVQDTIDYIMAAPHRYAVLGGDLLECATKTSVGMSVYEEDFSPKDQLLTAYRLLKPLAEAGKILCGLTGNHEMRLAYHADLNPIEVLCAQLEIPYHEHQGFLVLNVAGNIYRVALCHGGTNSVMASLRKQSKVVDADLYLSGHTHARKCEVDPIYWIDDVTGALERRSKFFLVCGSYLEYWGGYAEMKVLAPVDTGTVRILLHADRWMIEPDIPV